MSKKLAEGARSLVLDVKVGRGAFMKIEAEARELAATMVGLGKDYGVPTRALLTDMNCPLGRAVGNSVEITESLEVLAGGGPSDVVALTLALACVSTASQVSPSPQGRRCSRCIPRPLTGCRRRWPNSTGPGPSVTRRLRSGH